MNNKIHSSLLLILLLLAWQDLLATPAGSPRGLKPSGLSFIENKGQVTDQYYSPRNDIQFKLAATNGLNVFIGNGAIHYQFTKKVSGEPIISDPRNPAYKTFAPPATEIKFDAYRMDVELVGANPRAEVVTDEPQKYFETYYTTGTGKDGAFAHTFKRITYKNIYPAIDWVLYVKDGTLEHEFVVKEGGDPSDIKIRYSGATDLKIGKDGALLAATPFGNISEHAPYSYEQGSKKSIASAFVLTGDVLSYKIARSTGNIVIDPSLSWGTYFGTGSDEIGQADVADASGNVYMQGYTNSSYNIATVGAYQTSYGGNYDNYLVKFDISGSRQWSTYYGGSNYEWSGQASLAVDASGNVFMCGYTQSSYNIATGGAYQTYLAGSYDAFLVKFNSAGARQWATYYGGSNDDYAFSLATDASNNIYMAGYTYGSGNLATGGAYQTSFYGNSDGFLVKFDNAGNRLWCTYYGGSNYDYIQGLTCDASGNVYIGGYTQSSNNIASVGAYQTSLGGSNDAFVAKFDASGNRQWGTYYGSSNDEIGYTMAVDAASNVFLAGYTNSSSGVATAGAYQTAYGGNYDGFIVKFNNSGTPQWGTYFGGNQGDYLQAVTTDGSNVYVSGYTTSGNNIATGNAYQASLSGSNDAFLAELDNNGTSKIYGTYYGGTSDDIGMRVCTDNAGSFFLCGYTTSNSGIATVGAFQTSQQGGNDGFVAKFCFSPNAGTISGTNNVCVSSTVQLSETVNGGTWSATNANATVSAGGLVTGMIAGIDTIKYSLTNSCGTSSATYVVTVNPLPNAGTITGSSTVCVNAILSLSDLAPNGTWSATNANAIVSNAGVVTGVTGGLDTIVYTVVNGCGTATATKPITVSATVSPSISITASPGSTVCAGTSVTFTASIANGGPSPTYQWKVNNANVGSAATYTYTPSNNDVITCVLTSNASCATPATATSNAISMTVNPSVTPVITITSSPANPVCAGSLVTFTATTTNAGNSPSYQWKKNNVNVGTSVVYTDNNLSNGDAITCTLTSNAACATPATVTSNSLTMVVNPVVVPVVTISANPGNSICPNTPVTFTASAINGGPSPTYQWKVNNANVAVGTTFTTSTLNNNDVVTCVLTSNASCATPSIVSSNTIVMTVNPTVVPTITIAAGPGNTICAGTPVTFTLTATNAGPTPGYQWKKNNVNVGNAVVYTDNNLATGDVITCTLTSSAACATPTSVTSSGITMTVNPVLIPTISITASTGNTICPNTSVTFTATTTNGGPAPVYSWKKNNTVVGSGATYVTTSLANNDVVTCTLTSNATCANPVTLTSNAIVMTVTPNVTPAISIAASTGDTICAGTYVTFTATASNAGPSPVYQWKKNNVNIGANAVSFSDNNFSTGDVITCVLTSNATCASPATVSSNSITMTVNPVVIPSVNVTANPGNTICAGTTVTFSAAITNGGPAPQYQWLKNGNPVGNTPTYSDNALNTNDAITCVITSNANCAIPSIVAGNTLVMTVNPAVTASVSISSYPGDTVCYGASVAFLATAVNGGNNPSYQWKKNGNPIGTNNDIYIDGALNGGDVITCDLTSSAACATPATAGSNSKTIVSGNSHILGGLTGSTVTNNSMVNNPVDVRTTTCDLMATVTPSGASPVGGNTTVKVTLDPVVNMYNTEPYIQRHFDIEPDNNAASATANITLYAYQAEFDAYNAVAGPMGYPMLPTNGTDNGNVRVTQFHGTGTFPGNYSGAYEFITPSVSWDAGNHWWSISFPITGFSGFYIHSGNFPLQLKTVERNGCSLAAYPNPVTDKVTIEVSGTRSANSRISITDLSGKLLMTVPVSGNKAVADITPLASGMYLIRYSDDQRNETVKITKQ
ncbi:MAG: SBBP repeat-containing protein [Bacteroidetes bacterium]|nr:SBBP repeat-containing protein [Bacteroidota bacterium]